MGYEEGVKGRMENPVEVDQAGITMDIKVFLTFWKGSSGLVPISVKKYIDLFTPSLPYQNEIPMGRTEAFINSYSMFSGVGRGN